MVFLHQSKKTQHKSTGGTTTTKLISLLHNAIQLLTVSRQTQHIQLNASQAKSRSRQSKPCQCYRRYSQTRWTVFTSVY